MSQHFLYIKAISEESSVKLLQIKSYCSAVINKLTGYDGEKGRCLKTFNGYKRINREKSDKKQGAQKGHEGKTLQIVINRTKR